ncbi:MAG: alginate export family protein [Planctomycetota bacterium]|nr:alginate export family protein [Planctomycetota bacterium]
MTMDRSAGRGASVLLVLAAWVLPAAGQPAGGPGPAAPDDLEKAKTVCPWLSLNGDLRFREIFAPNMFLDKEDRHWQSYRGRIGGAITPCEDLSFNFRLVYEPMHYFAPHRELFVKHAGIIDNWVQNEAVFDTFNIQWKNVLKLPVTVTVGRQALIFGNGWLVLDGTPYDQSRTIFFDAVRTTIDFKECKTSLDVVYLNQRSSPDAHLPAIGQPDFPNTEQDEQGVIVYASNTSLKDTVFDTYFIYKHDDRVLSMADGVAPWQQGTNADIYAVGNRLAGRAGANWSYLAEYAYEWGNKNGQDINAFGFNSQLAYHLQDKWKSNVRMSYEFLSGDRPSTKGVNEQFDPLWGRWARWSELYSNAIAMEHRPGEMANMHRFGPGFTCNPSDSTQLDVDYHFLFTDTHSAAGLPYFSREGDFRGQALVANFRYQMTKHIAHSVRAEVFFPGNYYSDANNEVGAYFRYELEFSW